MKQHRVKADDLAQKRKAHHRGPGFRLGVLLGCVAGAVATAVATSSGWKGRAPSHDPRPADARELLPGTRGPASQGGDAYPSVDELMALPDAKLGAVDPAVVNLVVARGIPQFHGLDIAKYLKTLDAWAEEIRFDTERHRYRYLADPSQFQNSEIEYKVTWLASDVNAVFKIDYDLEGFDASNPSDLFLNGLIDRRRGTCVSMPMLYLALGWRLGYPIRAVWVPTHIFARWDDGTARVNIEATGYGGELPDEHYAEEFLVSVECRERGVELVSLSPRKTLALLLLARADYWANVGDVENQTADALRANLLFPELPLAILTLEDAWNRRASQDSYYVSARDHLLDVTHRIAVRDAALAEDPQEKLIFTDQGPVPVYIRPAEGRRATSPADSLQGDEDR